MRRGPSPETVPGRFVAAPTPDSDVVSPVEDNGVDGPDRSGVDGHQLDAKRQRLRMVLDDGGRRRQVTTLRHTGEIQQREGTVPHLPQPPVLMMLWIRTPIPVEEIAVLIHLVLIGTFLSGSPICSPYRDGEIEDGLA